MCGEDKIDRVENRNTRKETKRQRDEKISG